MNPVTTIFYAGVNVFSGFSPTPLISRGVTMLQAGERFGQLHTLTLRGSLTGQCQTFQQKVDRQKQFLSGFRRDFQTLDVRDSGVSVLNYPNVRIADISFDDTYYGPSIPYQISVEVYPSGYFSGYMGVLEPKEDIEFREAKDGVITISHTIAAKGLNTSAGANNATDNAKNWVYSRTGWNSQILPAFISGAAINACLQTQAEQVDRLNGTVSISETYTSDMYSVSGGTLRYTADFSSGIDNGISTVTVQGTIKGCKGGSLAGLRSRYAGFNAYSEALKHYQRITTFTDLYPTPLTKAVSEDQKALRSSFSFVYNNDPRPTVGFVYEISFSYDFENDTVSASIQGTVNSRDPKGENRWQQVTAFANQVNLYSLVVPAYNEYVADVAPHLASYPLNPHPVSHSRTDNEFSAEVLLSASYNNLPLPPPGLDLWNYTLNFQPSLRQYSPNPVLDGAGNYYTFDLGYARRAALSVSAVAQGAIGVTQGDVMAIAKNETLAIQNSYFQGSRKVLDSQQVEVGNAYYSGVVSINASWSAEQPEFSL